MTENRKLQRGTNNTDHSMDHVSIQDSLNSDNAYSDQGLENARVLEETLKKNK